MLTRFSSTSRIRSVSAAASRIRNEVGRLDLLIKNAAISNTLNGPTRPSGSMARQPVRAFCRWMKCVRCGIPTSSASLPCSGAMLPLLRGTPGARIVNVSSGVGSLTTNSDPAFPYRSIFGPVYPASKTALNALTLAMALELEPEGIKVNAVSPASRRRISTGTRALRRSRRAPGRRCALPWPAQMARPGGSLAGKTRRSLGKRLTAILPLFQFIGQLCRKSVNPTFSNNEEQKQKRKYMSTNNGQRLAGKTAVITGGATGIGLAAAKRFIEEGAFVFIFGRRQEALDAAVAELGPNARAVKGSVSDEADLDRLYAAVKAERGTLDIVFANAGVGSQLRLGEITAKHIDETFDINVKGTIFTVQKALPLMGKGGSIILTGSSAGTTGAPAFTAYSASKAAVRNLARTWAEDLKGTGIRVNVLSPGAIATELAKEALGEEGLKAYGSMTALQRMGDPAEVGAAAAFLASSDSSFMTASEVAVDGGLAQL